MEQGRNTRIALRLPNNAAHEQQVAELQRRNDELARQLQLEQEALAREREAAAQALARALEAPRPANPVANPDVANPLANGGNPHVIVGETAEQLVARSTTAAITSVVPALVSALVSNGVLTAPAAKDTTITHMFSPEGWIHRCSEEKIHECQPMLGGVALDVLMQQQLDALQVKQESPLRKDARILAEDFVRHIIKRDSDGDDDPYADYRPGGTQYIPLRRKLLDLLTKATGVKPALGELATLKHAFAGDVGATAILSAGMKNVQQDAQKPRSRSRSRGNSGRSSGRRNDGRRGSRRGGRDSGKRSPRQSSSSNGQGGAATPRSSYTAGKTSSQ